MISEGEARARAEFMDLVRRQLKVLRSRTDLEGADYLALLERSSLKLADIEWVRETLAEGVRQGRTNSVLERLIFYYEGYFEGLARVLEAKPDELESTFDRERIARVETEMRQRPTRKGPAAG